MKSLSLSDSLWPCGLQPTRLLCPWDSPGKSTGVGCHFLLQGIFPIQESNPGLPHCGQTVYRLIHQEVTYISKLRLIHIGKIEVKLFSDVEDILEDVEDIVDVFSDDIISHIEKVWRNPPKNSVNKWDQEGHSVWEQDTKFNSISLQ